MILSKIITEAPVDDLMTAVAQKVMTPKTMILPFVDFAVHLAELFKTFYKSGCRLVAAGHVTPEIEMAADRACVITRTMPSSAMISTSAASLDVPQCGKRASEILGTHVEPIAAAFNTGCAYNFPRHI